MVKKDLGVQIKVGQEFFDNLFEPARRSMESELGIRVGQRQFTSMLFKSGIKFKPKLLKFIKNEPKRNNQKKRRRN